MGALSYITLSIALVYLHFSGTFATIDTSMIFSLVAITFIIMLSSEYIQKHRFNSQHKTPVVFASLSPSYFYLTKSTLFRFVALFVPFYLAYFIIQNHTYFVSNSDFEPTKIFFGYLMWIFLLLGPVYIFLSLKYRGDSKYEFNDYALLTLAGVRSLWRRIFLKNTTTHLYRNRRVKKVFLVYLVNFFWLTLMSRFFAGEFHNFSESMTTLISGESATKEWFGQVRDWYFTLFHLLFIVDVGIALIGYAFASRWLDNRTKSVETTPLGWFVALACYPPFNTFLSNNFVHYDGLDTHDIITSDWAITVILISLLILYTIYVWATIALGFKFSNLTNRGIINAGPYRYIRHPAYAAKNIAWLIDFTYVYTNIWATLAFFIWNGIYVVRALTEERHLSKDPAYRTYQKKVKYRFIPRII
jgi:protein-S-isoprenylcysteine O-methyltransferase Ste14